MLTDAQIVLLLSQDGTREDMLKAAYRMGLEAAKTVPKPKQECSHWYCLLFGGEEQHTMYCTECGQRNPNGGDFNNDPRIAYYRAVYHGDADAIRAEASE